MKWLTAMGLIAVLAVSAGVVVAEPGRAGCGEGRGIGNGRFDPAKTETVTGTVSAVETAEGRRGRGMGSFLSVNTGTETLEVHLGPQWFLDGQTVKFTAGDTVEIKGFKNQRRGRTFMVASEVKKGSEVLMLRDENGVPAWAGSRSGSRCRDDQS